MKLRMSEYDEDFSEDFAEGTEVSRSAIFAFACNSGYITYTLNLCDRYLGNSVPFSDCLACDCQLFKVGVLFVLPIAAS